MAIRYDTPEDFERDKLKDQAANLKLQSERQASRGLSWIAISALTPAVFRNIPRWVAAGLDIMGIVGGIEVIRSWFTHSKARNLELERERMGPQAVVLPPDGAYDPSCGCPLTHSGKMSPKSHTDYAAKSDDTLNLKA